jgi:hypothetical protein
MMPVAMSDREIIDWLYFIQVGQTDDVLGQRVERPAWLTWRVNDGKPLKLIPAVSTLMSAAGYRPI